MVCGGVVVVVVVVVVRTWVVNGRSLSINRHRMHLIGWQKHLGASSRRPRQPFPALMAGSTLAVYLCTRP